MTNTHVCRCKTCDRQMGGVIPLTGAAWQLQKELSLAEEGLANYAEENERLKSEILEARRVGRPPKALWLQEPQSAGQEK